ncbi:hypothetical protein EON80_06670, partial [bacterium]
SMPRKSSGGGGNDPSMWLHSVQPYIKSYQLYKCPSDTKIAGEPGPGLAYTSYSANAIGCWGILKIGDPQYWPYTPPMSEDIGGTVIVAAVEAPSTTVQLLEGSGFQYYSHYAGDGTDGITPVNSTVDPRTMSTIGVGSVIERHLGTINTLFCDGHVKAMKLDALRTQGEQIGTTADKAMTYFTTKADPT